MSYVFSQRNGRKEKSSKEFEMKRYRELNVKRKNVSGHKRFPREYVFSLATKDEKNILNRKSIQPI